MNYYNCETSATITATFRLELYKNNFTIWAYALVQNQNYASILDSGNAISKMKLIARDEKTVLREIEFEAPLKQVINHYHHDLEKFRRDAVYMLLANNKLLKFKKTELENAAVASPNLTKITSYEEIRSKVIAFDAKLGRIAFIDTSGNLIIINEIT